MKSFPLKEFYKDWNKWKSKGAMPDEYHRWIKTSQPSGNIFCVIIEETWSCVIVMEDYAFYVDLIPDAFHWVLLSAAGIWSTTCWNSSFGFPEGAHDRRLPSNPIIYTASPLWDEDSFLLWLVVVHLWAPQALPFHLIVQCQLVTICFKTGAFSLCVSWEWHAEI